MVIENFLDLAREYLEPANSNHVLQPVDDANVAILINQAHVSGAQTFAEENLPIGIRAIPISLHHLRPEKDDFDGLPFRGRQRRIILIDQSDDGARQRLPNGADLVAGGGTARTDAAPFSTAIAF